MQSHYSLSTKLYSRVNTVSELSHWVCTILQDLSASSAPGNLHITKDLVNISELEFASRVFLVVGKDTGHEQLVP